MGRTRPRDIRALTIPGPEGLTGIDFELPAPPAITEGLTIINSSGTEETSSTPNPVTYWGDPYELKLEPSLFPHKGTVIVTEVVMVGTNGDTGEPMKKVVDVGGSIGGEPVGEKIGDEPLTVTIPALQPMHGEVKTSINYRFTPSGGPTPVAGVASPQILYEVYPPPSNGGEVPTDPLPAYFTNYGDPAGITIGPGAIVGPQASAFEVVPLKSVGVPPGTRDCGFAGEELFETYDGTPSNPPPGTECGIGVKFTPTPGSDRIYYYATLQATATNKGTSPNKISVALQGCNSKLAEAANAVTGVNSCGPTYEQNQKEALEKEIEIIKEELTEKLTPQERQQLEEVLKEREQELKEVKEREAEEGTEENNSTNGGEHYSDPSGTVLAKTEHGSVPLPGATVTLQESYSASGPFETVPNGSVVMSPANRTNPDTTNGAGGFGWDVLGGYYLVSAAKEGCNTETTSTLTIPPPITGLELTLTCASPPSLSATHTSVSSSASPATYGEPVTFTATVSGGSNPTGTVTFFSGGEAIGSGVLQNGTAAFTTSALAVGEYSITASYGGDGANERSSSTPIVQKIVTASGPTSLPPEVGRCLKVAAKTGKFASSSCKSEKTGGSYEWTPGAAKPKFTLHGEKTTFEALAHKFKLECAESSGSGEYNAGKRLEDVNITFSGCKAAAAACSSEGAPAGVIKSSSLEGALGWEDKSKDKVALDLFPTGKSGPLLQAKCSGSALSVGGSVLVNIKSDKMASTSALKYKASKGKQKPEHFEDESNDVLEGSLGEVALTQAGLTGTLTLTNEEALEISAVV